ncbi:MAG: hypothetical protein QXM68_03765 [Candidatus Aenigmatarchaeota archaeon]|nr:hypothetical protein [Candidatus Aenigmarchaeota archaeon]
MHESSGIHNKYFEQVTYEGVLKLYENSVSPKEIVGACESYLSRCSLSGEDKQKALRVFYIMWLCPIEIDGDYYDEMEGLYRSMKNKNKEIKKIGSIFEGRLSPELLVEAMRLAKRFVDQQIKYVKEYQQSELVFNALNEAMNYIDFCDFLFDEERSPLPNQSDFHDEACKLYDLMLDKVVKGINLTLKRFKKIIPYSLRERMKDYSDVGAMDPDLCNEINKRMKEYSVMGPNNPFSNVKINVGLVVSPSEIPPIYICCEFPSKQH